MADAAVTFVLENVTQLLKHHADLVSAGVENELKKLKNELGLLKAFLQETVVKKAKKKVVLEELERQIREFVYDAEETIDTCLARAVAAAAAAKANRRRNRVDPECVSLEIKEVIKSLREDKVNPILHKARTVLANKYMQIGNGSDKGLEESAGTTKVFSVQSVRQLKEIVGLEDEEETIINYLKEETEELDVISIIGMPGQGKTILAGKIYQNEKIRYAFPIRIWVYVSQEFTMRDVFLHILKGFTNQDMSSMDDGDLASTVGAYLEKAKFLLVLDDLWTVSDWNKIKSILPKSNRMGKVLITGRSRDVAKHANVAREPHLLRFLMDEDSWELLQLVVFGRFDGCPQELEAIGKYIANQCDGFSLAVLMMGGVLLEEYSETRPIGAIQSAWKKVSENAINMFNDREKRISDIVAFSYNKLPEDVRDCFLYLGVFPDDYEIPAWTLTRLWIAEGFIQHKEGQSLEDTAEEILKDLISRNLVMADKINPSGKVKTCRIDGLLREFCKSKAGIVEQNLFQEVVMPWTGVFKPPVSDIQKYRRLCIHSHLSRFLSEIFSGKLKAPRLRSFLCFCKETSVLDAKYISAVLDSSKLLRVLDSKSIKFTQFPKNLTNLIHLRYITLSCVDLNVLPKAVCELWNLQTLVVDTSSYTLEIKGSIWNMIKLRHLKTKAAIILQAIQEDLGRGAGENLHTLSKLSPKYCTEEVFGRACNLKRLGIRGRLAILLDAKSLWKLDSLETLKLKNDLFYESASKNPLPGLPPPNCFPPNIKRLTLSATFLDWKHMFTLGMIGTLVELKLRDRAFVGPSWDTVGGGFRSLRFLLIASTDLVFWKASHDHFPILGCLVLKNCEKLSDIPLSLAKSLQILDIEYVAKSAVFSARKIEQEKKWLQRGEFKLSIGPGCNE